MDESVLRHRLHELREAHRDLDAAIAALADDRGHDMLRLARLKKRKLHLKDEIAAISSRLLPDIIA